MFYDLGDVDDGVKIYIGSCLVTAELAIFWTTFARRTTGCGRTLPTRLGWCPGGITAIRSLGWATGRHWLIIIHGITVISLW